MKYVLAILFVFSINLQAEFKGQGEVSLELRQFEDDSVPNTIDKGMSVFTRVETYYEDQGSIANFRFMSRTDREDKNRNFVIFEEVNLGTYLDEEETLKVLAGYKIFNWTALEAFHPVDVINSRNYDSDLEKTEKKGELTLEVQKLLDSGEISFYFFPRFEKPIFPNSRSRLGAGVNINDPVLFVNGQRKEAWVPQFGTRLSMTLDGMDLSAHALYHVDRAQPLIGTDEYTKIGSLYLPNDATAFANNPTPFYSMVTQVGGTITTSYEGVLFKVESAYRVFDKKKNVLTSNGLRRASDHTEVALGLEYTVSHESGHETTLLFEQTGIYGVELDVRSELSPFQRDVLIGFRHAFNDPMGSELYATAIIDIERDSEKLFNLSFTRRLTDNWKYKAGVRVFDAPVKKTLPEGLELYNKDNNIYFNLSRFF